MYKFCLYTTMELILRLNWSSLHLHFNMKFEKFLLDKKKGYRYKYNVYKTQIELVVNRLNTQRETIVQHLNDPHRGWRDEVTGPCRETQCYHANPGKPMNVHQ